MNLEQIIAAARDRLDDNQEPYLWSDGELARFANDGEREACRRARLIIDSTTAEICQIALTDSEVNYELDSRILFIRRAKLAGRSPVLKRHSYKTLDRERPGWEAETGEPESYVPDQTTGQFRPYPSPDTAGTVALTVIRLPLDDMTDDSDEPEIKPHLHESMGYWIDYRAYSKQDAETKNDDKAAAALSMFEQEFGKKSTAIDEMWIEREHGYEEDEGIY